MAILDKGEQILDNLLLSQYKSSPILKQYLMAYIGEMDYLFQNIEEVYLGRMLDSAIGVQLDIIGVILNQSRNIDIQTIYFGFQGAPAIDGFGDTADPQVGGVFKSLEQGSFTVDPLDDAVYRRVLYCKANLLNRDDISIELIYESINILFNRVPKHIVVTEPASMKVNLELLGTDTRNDELLLISYMAKYFIPAGVTFTISTI